MGSLRMAEYRRIVTGHNAEGKSVVLSDGAPGSQRGRLFEMWSTATMPADNAGAADAAALRDVILEPDPNGTVFRFFEVVPESEQPSVEERQKAFEDRLASASEDERAEAHRLRPDTSRHPSMHRTKTVDYMILLNGEVSMLLDEGEVEMKPLDVLIQRGTNHGWVNHGTETALLMAVLIDAEPLPCQL